MDSLPQSLKLETIPKELSLKLKASKKKPDANWVRNKAIYLASALHAESHMKFFYKVAWNLPGPQIDDILDRARQKNEANPLYYFIGCCKSEMRSK